MKYQSSSSHCSKVISKVKVSERMTEWQNDRMTDRTKTICPPIFDLGGIKRWCLQNRTPIGKRIPCFKKVSHVVLLVPLQGQCFYVCRWDNMTWISPTRENGKTMILFFFSFVLDCIVVVKSPLSCLQYLERHLEQRAPPICISVFCALVKPFELLNTYFSCLAFLFPIFTKFTTCFR